MIQVKLYTRQGCGLCEQTQADLQSLQSRYPHKLEVIDIEGDEALLRQYTFEIPVVQIGPYTLKAPIGLAELEVTLAAQTDREAHIQKIRQSDLTGAGVLSNTWTRSDSFTYWLSRHYLALFNLFVFLYVGLPFLAPVLMRAGAQAPANLIYRAYGMVCHQLGYRSFYLFGEQVYYPRSQAGIDGVKTFAESTGLSEASAGSALKEAGRYTGELSSEQPVGYKIALCERDIAIYGGILFFGLLFSFTRSRWLPLPWYAWVLFGLAPIGLDGLSQLISQPPLNLIPFRESTPTLRVLTGGLFGFTTAWFGYPMVEETMAETRQWLGEKWQRIHRAQKAG